MKCWAEGPYCKGEVREYAPIEDPTRKWFDLCDTHARTWGEALRPLEKKGEVQ